MKNKISATIVADSINKQGNRITTMEVIFPRFILVEFNTHRMFSRNSASSRAIPFKKMLKSVQEDPFILIAWQKDHSGMQGTEYFEDDLNLKLLEVHWLASRDHAVNCAESFSKHGLTKQLANRLLEPFMYHKVLVTSTESSNFFNLRCPQYFHPLSEEAKINTKSKKDTIKYLKDSPGFLRWVETAKEIDWLKINTSMGEIHIMDLAEKMWNAINESTPKLLKPGQWHIPYGDNINLPPTIPIDAGLTLDEGVQIRKVKIAIARCARLSYQTLGDNPVIDYDADLKLFDMLLASGHLSPFEHVAKCMDEDDYKGYTLSYYDSDGDMEIEEGWCKNFKGFIQYRAILES